jgi:hypothetical protein
VLITQSIYFSFVYNQRKALKIKQQQQQQQLETNSNGTSDDPDIRSSISSLSMTPRGSMLLEDTFGFDMDDDASAASPATQTPTEVSDDSGFSTLDASFTEFSSGNDGGFISIDMDAGSNNGSSKFKKMKNRRRSSQGLAVFNNAVGGGTGMNDISSLAFILDCHSP